MYISSQNHLALFLLSVRNELKMSLVKIWVILSEEFIHMKAIVPIVAITIALIFPLPKSTLAGLEEDQLVSQAHFTIQRMAKDKNIGPDVRNTIQRAKAVMLFPNVLKGAFFVGAEGGNGILMAKDSNGNWGYPAFFTMGSASFGLQFGGQSQEILLLIMSDRGLASILQNEVKLGGDLSVAAGPVGVGAGAATTTNLSADIYSFSINQGVFVGASVEGAIIHPRKSKNKSYYGSEKATAEEIILKGKYQNVQANALRSSLRNLR